MKPSQTAPAAGLSERAKASLDLLVQHCLLRNLAPAGESARLKVIEALPRKPKEKQAVVLTIASPEFRLVLALHARLDEEGRQFFARLTGVDAAEWSQQGFVDALAERGNICCGALNRELGRYFRHVGMSTPNLIEREALGYLEALAAGHRRLYQIEGLSLELYATLFIAAYAPLDFHAQVEAATEEVDAGELEMF